MIVSFSKLGNMGRLGNQLFQIMSTIGVAKYNKAESIFPKWEYNKYFYRLDNEGEENINITGTFKEPQFHYAPVQANDSIDLLGYFQSEKYWNKDAELVRKIFTFRSQFWQKCRNEFPQYFFNDGTICIHIRRGDYVSNPNYYQLPITWYIKALFTIKDWREKNIAIFSDDIAYCKKHFECLPNVYYSEGHSDIEDLCMMTMCDEHILSPSTYSWWGAYLSEQKNVIHPKELFAGQLSQNDTKDFWPENWHCFWPSDMKLDLRDTTFTIPVFYDHNDRKKNADLCVCMLQKEFDTNIIIGEQGGNRFQYFEKHCRYVQFQFKNFHRTRMLNQMADICATPYVANWDCDVFVAPLQIYESIEQLRNGSDMVFPYDGRFVRLARENWFKKIERTLDIGVLGNIDLNAENGKKVPETSVGGAIMWNKSSFIQGGMENEHMISFGPEDAERNDRFTKLEYKITRANGCLFHINHWCGPDSSTKNPFFRTNHVELERIRSLSKNDLIKYINTWDWARKERRNVSENKGIFQVQKIKGEVIINGNSITLYDKELADFISNNVHTALVNNGHKVDSIKTVLTILMV